MAIIITPGANNANSYADVAYADSYYEVTFYDGFWTSFTTEQKENALVLSARAIDNKFMFTGFRKNGSNQSLAFPRINSPFSIEYFYYDLAFYQKDYFGKWDDYETPYGEVPEQVRRAQLEMLMYLKINQSTTDGSIAETKQIKKIETIRDLANVEYFQSESSLRQAREAAGASLEAVKNLLYPFMENENEVKVTQHLY